MDQPPPYDEAIHYPTPPGQGKYQKFTQFLRYRTFAQFLPVFYNFIYVIIKGTSASKRISVSNANECQHDQNTTEAPLNPDIGDMWPIMSRCAMTFVIVLPALFIIIFLLRALLLSNGWNKLHHFPPMA